MITNLPLTFADLFPNKKITQFKTGSELLLAYYLNKYSMGMLGRPFVTESIPIDKHIARCRYNAFVYHRVYKSNTTLAYEGKELNEWLARQKLNLIYDCDSSTVKPISVSDTCVTYRFTYDEESIRAMRSARQTGYVDLVAYNIIYNYKFGTKHTVLIDNRDCEPRDNEYVDLIILRDYGNKLFDTAYAMQNIGYPIVQFAYMDSDKTQPDYEADIEYNRQRGAMLRAYKPTEKYNLFIRRFTQGDVVLIYKRKNPHKKKLFEVLNSCSIGIIRGADANGVSLYEIPSPETKLTQYKNITEIMAKCRSKIYTENDKYTFTLTERYYSWLDIGVCEETYDEGVFIKTVIQEDGCEQWLSDGVTEQKVFLSTPDVCYAVLEDRGVQYNKLKFVQTYFKNTLPVYEAWRQKYEANKRAGLCK